MKRYILIPILFTTLRSFAFSGDINDAWKPEEQGYLRGSYTEMPVKLYKYVYNGETKFGAVIIRNEIKSMLDCIPAKRDEEETDDYQLECVGWYPGVYEGDWEVPEYYTQEGDETKYPVIGLDWGSFAEENISSIKFPETVVMISNHAFYNCKNLKELDLSSMRNFDFSRDIVANCPMLERLWLSENPTEFTGIDCYSNYSEDVKLPVLKEIYSPSVTPLTNQVFDFRQITPEGFDNIKLYVKPGCEEVYRADPLWGQFRNILPYDFAARAPLSEVATSDIEFRVYDTRGNLVATSPDFAGRGIYILQEISAGTVKTIKIRK